MKGKQMYHLTVEVYVHTAQPYNIILYIIRAETII